MYNSYRKIDKNSRDYLTTGEIGKMLQVSNQTVINWTKSGKIKVSERFGTMNSRKILNSDFLEFLTPKTRT